MAWSFKGDYNGDPVKRAICPGCSLRSIIYNGTYWCPECGWSMPDREHRESPAEREIIKLYLAQCYQRAEANGNKAEMDRIAGYLVNYADNRP